MNTIFLPRIKSTLMKRQKSINSQNRSSYHYYFPGLGRSPEEGNRNPLQDPCRESPMDREAWEATVHGVAKSQSRLSDFTFSSTMESPQRQEFCLFCLLPVPSASGDRYVFGNEAFCHPESSTGRGAIEIKLVNT